VILRNAVHSTLQRYRIAQKLIPSPPPAKGYLLHLEAYKSLEPGQFSKCVFFTKYYKDEVTEEFEIEQGTLYIWERQTKFECRIFLGKHKGEYLRDVNRNKMKLLKSFLSILDDFVCVLSVPE